MPESNGEIVFDLIDAQFLEGIFVGTFEDRLDHCKPDTAGFQRSVQFLQSGKSMQMAATAPMLKREHDLRAYAQIR